ncbi:hypothetical protein Tco_0487319 [Tanacetum coccineum]
MQKSLSKPVTTQSLPKIEKDQLLQTIAYLGNQNYITRIRSCQKEYHELRTLYNALKVKFDSLNRKRRETNVSKSSKPRESVSAKVHTGESSKPFSRRVSQFTTYSLQKDRKFFKNSQSFETLTPQKGFKTRASNIIMANIIPPNHVDDLPIVKPNQPDVVPVIPEHVLVDENKDPEEEEFEEEEEP